MTQMKPPPGNPGRFMTFKVALQTRSILHIDTRNGLIDWFAKR